MRLLFLLLMAVVARAQFFDASRAGDLADLSGNWRFHEGDDPQWARPEFDDSKWQLRSSQQGVLGYSGMFWYRLRVKVPPEALALLINDGVTSYEVFANGVKIGQFGGLPPHEFVIEPGRHFFGIPGSTSRAGEIVIALRFWQWPVWASYYPAGPRGNRGVLIGPERAIETQFLARLRANYLYFVPNFFLASFAAAVAIGLVLLYRLQPKNREYLWLAGALLCLWMADPSLKALRYFGDLPLLPLEDSRNLFEQLGMVLMIQFVVEFLGLRRSWLIVAYQISVLLLVPLVVFSHRMGIPIQAMNVLGLVWAVPTTFGIPLLLLIYARHGNREAGLLFLSIFLYSLNDALNDLSSLLFQLGASRLAPKLRVPDLPLGPLDVKFDILASICFVISVCAVIFYRYRNTERDRMRAISELDAARSVQLLMIPRIAPSTPGFQVESLYVPAQEVGGDFFQVMSVGDGSMLAVVGDVSGKGMKAAMVVSMLVGVLRDVSQELHRPGEILRRLNRSLVGGGHDGFVTCLALLAGKDGTVIAANAGHLSPYCNGIELEVEAGLPLGVVEGVEYGETVHRVHPGDRLWMISDGIVEARDAKGGLFGFERVAAQLVVSRSVQDAIPAKEFVPDDDMTVLVVRREA